MPETTIKLTKADFDADNNYIGKYDLSNATQTIETEINLGCLKFKGSIKTKKSILIAYGCGISAGGGGLFFCGKLCPPCGCRCFGAC